MKRPRRKTLNELKADCIVWNHEHAVGTKVMYHPVIGEAYGRPTRTTGGAFVMSEHTAVVDVEREGVVCLEALEILEER